VCGAGGASRVADVPAASPNFLACKAAYIASALSNSSFVGSSEAAKVFAVLAAARELSKTGEATSSVAGGAAAGEGREGSRGVTMAAEEVRVGGATMGAEGTVVGDLGLSAPFRAARNSGLKTFG
jgi:hypothetical protein